MMKQIILYVIFIIFAKLMQMVPSFIRRSLFFCLARLVYLVAFKKNKIIKSNLDFIFGKKKLSLAEVKEIKKYGYYNMALWAQTLIEGSSFSDSQVKSMIKVENEDYITKPLREKKRIILISAHYGNIEMLSLYVNKFICPLVQVARESNFSLIDGYITKAREHFGGKIIFKSGALKYLVQALKRKETICLVIDQNINIRQGTKVKFLGKTASQTASTAFLAKKFDAYIIPMSILNKPNSKYKIKFHEPIIPIESLDKDVDIKRMSQLQADSISKIILEDKKQWFWAHRRFKFYDKNIYD